MPLLLPLTTSNLPQAVATGLLGASEAVPNRMPQPPQLRLRLKWQGRQQRISKCRKDLQAVTTRCASQTQEHSKLIEVAL